MSRIALALSLLLALAPAAPALAVDGVIEINQAKALAGAINGSLTDDPPGFPVTITRSGSYRLTGNLDVADGNTTAISITFVNPTFFTGATIDLGGFRIMGPNIVSSSGLCTAGGTGRGIVSSVASTVVRNGSVRGMGSDGVYLGRLGRIEGIIAHDNCGFGLRVWSAGTVFGSQVERNSTTGIYVGEGGLVKDSAAFENTTGINLDAGALALGCVIMRNRGYGLTASGVNAAVGDTVFVDNVLGHADNGRAISCIMINSTVFCASPGWQ